MNRPPATVAFFMRGRGTMWLMVAALIAHQFDISHAPLWIRLTSAAMFVLVGAVAIVWIYRRNATR
jgi:hypothetical protein